MRACRASLSSLSSPTSLSSSPSRTNTTDSTSLYITSFLIANLNFPKPQAISISNRFSTKRPKNLSSVITLLQTFGFSTTQIQTTIRTTPQILFLNPTKILQPKLNFFKQLGFTNSNIGQVISKNTSVLTTSLHRRLIPNVQIIKTLLPNQHHDLIQVLSRCKWVISKDPNSRLLPNIEFLQSRGIIGSQLSTLLKRQPILILMKQTKLRKLVSKAEEVGFKSRMLVHGLYTLSSMSDETLKRKFGVFKKFGFSQEECVLMMQRVPGLMRCSEEKLELGIEFFLKVVGFEKGMLFNLSRCLMYGLEKRVIPRYRVVEVLVSKKLLKKKPSFVNVIDLTEEEFLERFISRYKDNAEELLVVYKCDDDLFSQPEEP